MLDIDELIKPRIEEERRKQVDAAREEALEHAIATVKAKLQELADQAKEETGMWRPLVEVMFRTPEPSECQPFMFCFVCFPHTTMHAIIFFKYSKSTVSC